MGAITRGIGHNGIGTPKPLVTAYDKPTIYYPLADLISVGITDILVIAAPDNVDQFRGCLGNGNELGVSISYEVQEVPRGIADAFIVGEQFIGNEDVALIFGDNIFSGRHFSKTLKGCTTPDGATVFAYRVPNPEAFGVVEFDVNGTVISLEEKPSKPKSHHAVVGIYFYRADVVEIAKRVTPSDRGELEITSVNQAYLEQGRLSVTTLDSDTTWFDTGTPESLADASEYVRTYQAHHGQLLGSPEASAYLAGRIDQAQLIDHASRLKKSAYGDSLMQLAKEGW